jgi:hypothetical protein
MENPEHPFHPGGLVPGGPVTIELPPDEPVLTLEQGRALARTVVEVLSSGDDQPS